MTRNRFSHVVIGVAVLAISACDRPVQSGAEAVSDSTSKQGSAAEKVACIDPKTGELTQPGPGIDCSVPEQAKVYEEPVIKDLEGGGQLIDPKGRFDQKQEQPATANRVVVIDRQTGEVLNQRPSDPNAAIRYDRSIERLNALMERQSRRHPAEVLYAEPLANGGFLIDPQGRFQIPLVATKSADGQFHVGH